MEGSVAKQSITWQVFHCLLFRAVCRKHELMQYDLEMAAQDLTSKKQQCEELATGVSLSTFFSKMPFQNYFLFKPAYLEWHLSGTDMLAAAYEKQYHMSCRHLRFKVTWFFVTQAVCTKFILLNTEQVKGCRKYDLSSIIQTTLS